jgi:hypothetical protein
MNRHFLVAAAAALSLFGTASVFAQEARQDDAVLGLRAATASRADVEARRDDALRAGERVYGEASPAPAPASTSSKAEVRGQTQEARRHGALGFNEAGPAAAPAA